MATSRYGLGIALQGVPKDRNNEILSQMGRIETLRAKRDIEAADDMDKYTKDIFGIKENFHRTLVPDVNARATEAYQRMMRGFDTDRNGWRKGFYDTKNDLEGYLRQAKAESDNRFANQKIIDEAVRGRRQLPEPVRNYGNILKTGTDAELRTVKEDPLGAITFGPDGEAMINYTVPSTFNVQQKTASLLNDIAKSNMATLTQISTLPGTAGKLEFMQGRAVPESENDARAAELQIYKATGVPVSLISKEAALVQQYAGDQDIQNWYRESRRKELEQDMNLLHDDAALAKGYFNLQKGLGGQSYTSKVVAPVKPTEAEKRNAQFSWGLKQMMENGLVARDEKVIEANTDQGPNKEVTVPYSQSYTSSKPTVITADNRTINLKSGTSFKTAKSIVFRPGSTKIVPKRGPKGSWDGTYEAMVYGTAVDVLDIKVAADKENKTVEQFLADNPDWVEQQNIGVDVAVPLGKVEGFLKNDVKVSSAWVPEALQEVNSRKKTTAPSSAKAPPKAKTITKKQYSKSRNQTKITYSDGTTEIIDGGA